MKKLITEKATNQFMQDDEQNDTVINIEDNEPLEYIGTRSVNVDGYRILTFVRYQSHTIIMSNEKIKNDYDPNDCDLLSSTIPANLLYFNILFIKHDYSFIEMFKSSLMAILKYKGVSTRYDRELVFDNLVGIDTSLKINIHNIIQNRKKFKLSEKCINAIISELDNIMNDRKIFYKQNYTNCIQVKYLK